MAIITNGICTTNKEIDILSGTGNLKIGTDAANTISISGSALASTVNINPGSAINIGSAGGATIVVGNGSSGSVTVLGSSVTLNTSGNGTINLTPNGTGGVTIGTQTSNKTITIGATGSATDTIKIGNATTSSATSVSICSTQTSGATVITIGTNNTSGTGTTSIRSGSGGLTLSAFNGGAVNLGTAATAQTVTIGNVTGATALVLNSGTAGYVNTTTNGVFTVATGTGTVTISGDATANAINIATGAAVKSLTLGSTNTTSSVTINTGSGGITIPSFTTTGALVSTSAGLITDATASTTGFILASNGSSTAPSFQSMSSLGGFTWNNTTGSTQTMAVNNGYVSNDGATLVTFTLPATAAVLQRVSIQGAGSGLWTIAQNAGQTIHSNYVSTTTGVTGTVSSTNQYDSIDLICITANTDFAVRSIGGNVNFV